MIQSPSFMIKSGGSAVNILTGRIRSNTFSLRPLGNAIEELRFSCVEVLAWKLASLKVPETGYQVVTIGVLRNIEVLRDSSTPRLFRRSC